MVRLALTGYGERSLSQAVREVTAVISQTFCYLRAGGRR